MDYHKGTLRKTPGKRWVVNEIEITSGDVFELYLSRKWKQVRMEFGPHGYYTIPIIPLCENMKARIKANR